MMHPFFDVERPVVIGHRGAAGTHPENTRVSFEAALAQGAQILESDLHVTRDGVPVLIHDSSVDRISDAKGEVSDFDWAELSRLDAGHSFLDASGRHAFRGQGYRIPSLEEAFAAFPEARFNLEIKCRNTAAIRTTLDCVQRFDRADRTLLAAGEDDIMSALREALLQHTVEPALGASLGEIVAAVRSALAGEAMPPGVMALQIPPDFANQPLATPQLIDHAHANEVEVHVWTINDLAEIEALTRIGVDGIVTDLPGQMADWLKRNGHG